MIITSRRAGQPGGEWRLLGFLIGGAGVVAVGWGVSRVLETTSCATGGGFPWLRECAGLTATSVVAIVAGAVVAAVGMAVAGLLRYVPAFLLVAAGAGACVAGVIGDPAPGRAVSVGIGLLAVMLGGIPLWIAQPGDRDQRDDARGALGATGLPAVASVLEVGPEGTDTPGPSMRVRLLVAREDGTPPYEVEQLVPAAAGSRLRQGHRLSVWVDPADPDRLAVRPPAEAPPAADPAGGAPA